MFRRRLLSSVLALGMFAGACDMTGWHPGVSPSFELDAFNPGKASVQMSIVEYVPEGPPDGTTDPPGAH